MDNFTSQKSSIQIIAEEENRKAKAKTKAYHSLRYLENTYDLMDSAVVVQESGKVTPIRPGMYKICEKYDTTNDFLKTYTGTERYILFKEDGVYEISRLNVQEAYEHDGPVVKFTSNE